MKTIIMLPLILFLSANLSAEVSPTINSANVSQTFGDTVVVQLPPKRVPRIPPGMLPPELGRGVPKIVYEQCNYSGCWSPLAQKDLFIMNSDGTGKIKIPHPSGIGNITRRDPALSPDGTRIAFASNGTAATDLKQLDIYVSKVDGSGFVRLTQMQRCEQPAWSPNGFKIAFTRQSERTQPPYGEDVGIWIMNADGSNLNRPGIFNRAQWPAWSPDGKSILYVVQTQAVIPHSDIYIHDLASDQSRLVPGAGAHSWVGLGAKAAWSPDSSKIAFTRAGGWLEVINPDGTGRAQLTSKGYNDFSIDIKPTWSPDGRKIAFQRIYSPGWGQSNESEIWVVDSIGGLPSLQSERRLTRPSSGTLSHDGHFQGAPSWGSVPTVPVAPPIVR